MKFILKLILIMLAFLCLIEAEIIEPEEVKTKVFDLFQNSKEVSCTTICGKLKPNGKLAHILYGLKDEKAVERSHLQCLVHTGKMEKLNKPNIVSAGGRPMFVTKEVEKLDWWQVPHICRTDDKCWLREDKPCDEIKIKPPQQPDEPVQKIKSWHELSKTNFKFRGSASGLAGFHMK